MLNETNTAAHKEAEVGPNILVLTFLPSVLCDPTDLIWRKETPFEAMTGRRAFTDGLLAEVFL